MDKRAKDEEKRESREPAEKKETAHPKASHSAAGAGAAPAPVPPKSEPAKADEKLPEAELDALKRELETLKNRHVRLQADFDNVRKRAARDKADIHKRANEDIMLELVPVLDHIDIALQHANGQKDPAAIAEGLKLIGDQLMTALKKFGLQPVETPMGGATFDPSRHEAVAHLPSDAHPDGAVIQQTRRGFMLNGQLLRPTQVVVSSGVPEMEACDGDED